MEDHHHQQHVDPRKGHEDHDQLHFILLMVIVTLTVLSQVGILIWKSRSPQTFLTSSLFMMWLFRILWCLYQGYFVSIALWCLFTLLIFRLYRMSTTQPLDRDTPKLVYMWFFVIYLASYYIAWLGLIGFFFRAYDIYIPVLTAYFDSFIFCGLYYGVIGRDFAEICSNRIANILGFGGSRLPTTKLSNDYCAICTGSLDNNKHNFTMESAASYANSITPENKEKTVALQDRVIDLLFSKKSCKLTCGHSYHLYCIRGWALVGKNNVCPNCNEKVDIKSFCDNPWEKTSMIWGILLDSTRYLVSWNPILFIGTQSIIYIFDK